MSIEFNCTYCDIETNLETGYISDEGWICPGCYNRFYKNPFLEKNDGHFHNWKTYVGFTETYEYCDGCGEKKK